MLESHKRHQGIEYFTISKTIKHMMYRKGDEQRRHPVTMEKCKTVHYIRRCDTFSKVQCHPVTRDAPLQVQDQEGRGGT